MLAPDPLELVVEDVAGHGVERAERLVHEQHVGVLRERAGERDALAHAAGELVGPLLREAGEVHELEQLGRASRGARGPATLRSCSASSTLPRAVSHGNSAASWNMSVVPAARRSVPGGSGGRGRRRG